MLIVQVKRVESANQLAMPVASDDEDDAVDELLEQKHQIMRSSSAYSLASNPDSNNQQQVQHRYIFYSALGLF